MHYIQNLLRFIGCNNRNKLTLISHIQWVKAQHFTSTRNYRLDRDSLFVEDDADLRSSTNFIKSSC